jgi:hypothetical protein
MNQFREFDFTHPAFVDANPKLKEILLRAYKSKMSCSDFIDAVISANITSRYSKKNQGQYRNAHKISERYEKLDCKFNFFGNYKVVISRGRKRKKIFI